MDKNKNRTNLLAAGRKRLQQFRQNKDSKGSKSSGKAGKSEHDSDADAASADVASAAARPTTELVQVPDEELRSVHDSDTRFVDSTVACSGDKTDIDIATNDPFSVPESSTETTIFASNVELPPEDPGVNEGAYQFESTFTVNPESARPTSSGNSESLVSEMDSVHFAVPMRLDSCTPSDLVGAIEPVAVEAVSGHGADQVPDGSDCLASKQVDRSDVIAFEGDARRGLHCLIESAETFTGAVSGDTGMKKPAIEIDQPKLNVVSASAGVTNEVNEVWTMDGHLVSAQPLPESHGSPAVPPDVAVYQREDVVATSFNEKMSEIPSAEWIETNMKPEGHGKEKLMESKMVSLSSDVGVISVSLSQLMEVLRRLDEEEFRLLVTSSEAAATADFSTASSITNAELRSSGQLLVPGYQSDDVLERFKEQLYLMNLAKDVFLLQLDEQMELQMEFDHQRQQLLDEVSNASTLISEVQGRNESLAEELAKCNSELQAAVSTKEELEKQFHTAKAEVMEISIRADELQVELERSHGELSSLSVELADCKALLSDLHVENDNLNGNLSLLSEEKKNLAEERGYLVIENEKVLTELAECRGLLQSLQIENVNLSGRLALITGERMKLEELQGNFVHENEKLLTELSECKALLEVLQLENANLNGGLTLVLEEKNKIGEEKDHVVAENEKLSMELADCRGIVASLQMEHHKAVDGLKEATLRLGQVTEENIKLSSQSGEFVNQGGFDMPSGGQERGTDADETHPIPSEGETELFLPPLIKPNDGLVDVSTIEQLKLDICDQSFVFLKRRLEEAERMILKLENAIEGMHLHSVSLSMSSGKMVAPGVSRLIQAFESGGHHDNQDTEEGPSTENQLLGDPYMLIMEQAGNLRAVLKDLVQNAENISEIFKRERHCRIFADAALGELKVTYEALKEHCSSSEAANIELAVLYEFIKQHVFDTEAKKCELLALYEVVKQQIIILEAKNIELVKKLGDFQSRISELQRQLDGMRSSSDEIASSISNEVEVLHKEIAERASILEQQWNSTVALVVETVGKLDALIGSSFSSILSTDNSDGQDIGSCVAASVDAATKVIEDLQVNLKASRVAQDETQSSYKDMIEKFNGLHEKHELAVSVLHRIYGNLKKLVNDSRGYGEQSQIIIQNENLLDPIHLDICDTLMEQLAVLLGERLQLESVNNKLNSELIGKTKDMEELRKRGVDSDAILKLVEDIEGAVKLESTGIEDELESRLQSLTSFLLQKYREADEQVRLSGETKFSKDMELSELQGQINHLSSLIVRHENEILALKESLRQGAEDLASVRNELQDKVNELEQSEQRVSSIREKLSIAVSKGKGLIVQRDNLKQSLAETSNELEKCLQELHLKDARLREVETNLKTYSEAGERVEALESELSYIRNSATALRESFLLKDSVLQRVEEILEDLELPEQFHARDIIEKVDWLARSVAGNSLPLTDWDQKSSVVEGSYSDAGFVETDAWKEETQQNSNSGDDLRRKYEELQSKFYGLAEQNEMLEQSLIKRNNVVQRWEEILERINMPLQLRSMEPEDRIEWLGSALSEAHHHCNSLQQKVDNLETYSAALSADLEESQKSLSDLEPALQAVTCEKEYLSNSLEVLTHDYDKVSEKVVQFEVENDKLQNEVTALQDKVVQLELENDKLQNEVTALEERLVEKVGNQEHIESEIKRLADLVGAVLQDSVTEDVVSGGTSIECLEKLLQKLVAKCTTLSVQKPVLVDSVDRQDAEKAGFVQDEMRVSEDLKEDGVAVLRKELEEALRDLLCVKEERDRYMENAQSLVCDVEALNVKRQELQGLLSQEEQKSASVREKLNVAVRKGKLLVQQRDNLKQTIEEVNNEVEHLKSEINNRESSISDYEQKIKDLSAYQERVVVLESESLLLRNQLAETECSLQEKTHTMNLIVNTLNDIGVDFDINISNPVAKLEQIGNRCRDLHAAVASSEHDSRKSKRAAELLLSELNEVQERNDGLQEELAKAASELSELSRERDLAEAAKREAFSRVEKLSSNLSEERHNQFAELMALKSCVVQLRKGFFDINDLLGNVLSKDLEYLHNLEASMMSCLESSEVQNVFSQPLGRAGYIISGNEENKEKFMATNSLLDSKMRELVDDNSFAEICSLVGHQLQDLMKEISAVREELYKHLIILDEGTKHLSERLSIFHREATSQKQSFKSMEENIIRLEAIEKEKDTEIVVMRRSISLLYEACSSSVLEIENLKTELVGSGFAATDMGMSLESSISTDSGNLFSRQTILSSEECIRTMADRLLSVVKEFTSVHAKIIEGGQKEMKTTISNLQKELQEKDIQKDRICVELVNQIKEAEATGRGHLQNFQSAKAQLHDLERQLEVNEEDRNGLEERVKELQDGEATLKDLEERVKSLNNTLAAKEQEIEALMQALDEEETQMEGLTNKIGELETVVQQRNLDLESLEASRGKAMKKLSITVNKFDELHHLSACLLSEVEKLQSQLQERDVEISFLRQEVTRCTNDALVASQMSNKGNSDEIRDLLAWLDAMISRVRVHDVHFDDKNADQVHEYKEIIQKQIVSLISEFEDLRAVIQSRDMLLQVERSRVEELARKGEYLENSLREKESQLTRLQGVGDSGQMGSMASEIMEVEPVINKRAIPGTSITPQVRSLRKVNNDQVAVAIDVDHGSGGRLEDEDDDKAHGFKSLTTSRIVPRFTRPVTDMIDGLWVTCDRTLMRQPALRLVLIVYWAVLHALLATFVV